ncbi:hypothetical protein BURCENBC7_AP6753 [Burkholderia cenocepacia BC7]|nr:hypothetical protein BURCENBC7_AP6753 [Burkholderia cenocepacia BC7]
MHAARSCVSVDRRRALHATTHDRSSALSHFVRCGNDDAR